MPAATVQAESDEDYDKVEAEFENETDDEGREESGEGWVALSPELSPSALSAGDSSPLQSTEQPAAPIQESPGPQDPRPTMTADTPRTDKARRLEVPAPASQDFTAPEEHQPKMLGERLYTLIKKHHEVGEQAGKITGMLLQGKDTPELRHLIESPEALREKIAEAICILAQHGAQPFEMAEGAAVEAEDGSANVEDDESQQPSPISCDQPNPGVDPELPAFNAEGLRLRQVMSEAADRYNTNSDYIPPEEDDGGIAVDSHAANEEVPAAEAPVAITHPPHTMAQRITDAEAAAEADAEEEEKVEEEEHLWTNRSIPVAILIVVVAAMTMQFLAQEHTFIIADSQAEINDLQEIGRYSVGAVRWLGEIDWVTRLMLMLPFSKSLIVIQKLSLSKFGRSPFSGDPMQWKILQFRSANTKILLYNGTCSTMSRILGLREDRTAECRANASGRRQMFEQFKTEQVSRYFGENAKVLDVYGSVEERTTLWNGTAVIDTEAYKTFKGDHGTLVDCLKATPAAAAAGTDFASKIGHMFPSYNFVVLGMKGVGKSTFIKWLLMHMNLEDLASNVKTADQGESFTLRYHGMRLSKNQQDTTATRLYDTMGFENYNSDYMTYAEQLVAGLAIENHKQQLHMESWLPWQSWTGFYSSPVNFDQRPHAALLIVKHTNDHAEREGIRRFYKHLRSASVEIVVGVTHLDHTECTQDLKRCMIDFAQKIGADKAYPIRADKTDDEVYNNPSIYVPIIKQLQSNANQYFRTQIKENWSDTKHSLRFIGNLFTGIWALFWQLIGCIFQILAAICSLLYTLLLLLGWVLSLIEKVFIFIQSL